MPIHVSMFVCMYVYGTYKEIDDPLVGSIAQQYLNNRDEHDNTASEWTKR